jgi:hypothetical protein
MWGGTQMSDAEKQLTQWRERLVGAHQRMQAAMAELIDNKDYSAAESQLRVVDKLMVDLIEDANGYVVRSSD